MNPKAPVLFLLCLALSGLLLFSPLGFVPIPWPDASAFYLPGWDWVRDPAHFQMRSQAAFIPSYLIANFNTMPALPLLFGAASLLPLPDTISHTLLTRALSLIALIGFALTAVRLCGTLAGPRLRTQVIALFAVLLIFSEPVLRWGTLVVRPEIWIGWIWAWILIELSKPVVNSKRVGLALALSASFHFEAIALALPVALAVWWHPQQKTSPKQAAAKVASVALWTLLFLSPWLLYVAFHWSLFWSQMELQFLRVLKLEHPVSDIHSLFHSLIPSLGHPVGWPKLLNPAKALLWIGLLLSSALPLCVGREKKHLAIAHAAVSAIALAMWWKKPEVWFLTLFHACLVLAILCACTWIENARVRLLTQTLTALLALIQLASMGLELRRIPSAYSHSEFKQWAQCVRRAVGESPKSLWQPHTPDLLTEMRSDLPNTEFTRSFDFESERATLERWVDTQEVIVFTTSRPEGLVPYEGAARDQDLVLLSDEMSVAFGSFGARRVRELKLTPEVCVSRVFWALILRQGD